MKKPSNMSIEDFILRKRNLLREEKYSEARDLINFYYGLGSSEAHASICELDWKMNKKLEALSAVLSKLRSGDYSLHHVFLAAKFSLELKDNVAAEYLLKEFQSKYAEQGSLALIRYTHAVLNNGKIDDDMRFAARVMLSDSDRNDL